MHFSKIIRNIILFVFFTFLLIFISNNDVCAGVARDIQDEYEGRYENRVFILREDLFIFKDLDDDPEIVTDMNNFIYDIDNKELKKNIVFKRGESILIEDLDFDRKKIEVSIRSIDTNQKGEIIFDFNKRLSSEFYESTDFIRRFDEIFLNESLKMEPVFTDRISNKITTGEIQTGITRRELFLTLGKPFDIVTVVNSQTRQEEWIYKEEARTYRFYFEQDRLVEWVAH